MSKNITCKNINPAYPYLKYARQKRNEVKYDKNSIWYCSQLLNHYQMLGIGLPRYDYFLNEQTNLIQAQILLPGAKVYLGDPCMTHAQAAESAARKVYEVNSIRNVTNTTITLGYDFINDIYYLLGIKFI